MKRVIFAIILSLAFLLIISTASPAAETELWSSLTVKKPIFATLFLYLKPEWRFRSDMKEHYYTICDLGPLWKLSPNLDIEILYARKSQLSGSAWTNENRYMLDGIYKWTFAEIKWDSRNRLEYQSLIANWIYRNRLRLQKQVNKVTPYLYDEIFYSFQNSTINENRLSIGLLTNRMLDLFRLDLGYMLRDKKSGSNWTRSSVWLLGITN